jgi:quercetin dioxygenase-like cupin family protein
MSAFADIDQLSRQRIWDGVAGRVIQGQRVTLAIVELEPGSAVPEHSHDNEQVGVCVAGSLSFRVGDEECELGRAPPGASSAARRMRSAPGQMARS